ncbi:MAG: homoserine kinase [Alphaproteobacteria bacterium]|nr:homoserine kinase [Alphaproteobacteria bacterium]
MAVYTKVSDSVAADFLSGFDIGTLVELLPIKKGVENTNYILATNRARYILTLYEKRVNEADLPFFIGLMRHLAAKGMSVPAPVADKEGRLLHRLADRPAAITSFLPGASIEGHVTPDACAEVGRALAQMHVAGADYHQHSRKNGMGMESWQKLVADCAPDADKVQADLRALIENEITFLAQAWPVGLPQGVIHADLFTDNVFFDARERCSGLIDFYFACNDSLAYDLIITMNAWCFEHHAAFNVTKARAMLRAYQTIRPLQDAEKQALPVLARGACLRFLLTRLYDALHADPNALVSVKDPLHYVTRLQFHQRVKDCAAYGIHE